MKFFLFFILLFAPAFLSAQDIIYTISGEVDNENVSLDSILVENLTNGTRILFDNLPVENDYHVNLTKKAYWGTTGITDYKSSQLFVVAQNVPGMLTLNYQGNIPVNAKVSVFDVKGRKLYSKNSTLINQGNSIDVQLAATGVYFVRIESGKGVQTFKGIGSTVQTKYGVVVAGFSNIGKILKKALEVNSDFSFNVGDSLRISVYKNDYYAEPSGLKITTSQAINFQFKVSQVPITGISDAYVALDENTTSVTAYNDSTGTVQLHYTGENPGLKPGDIIPVDVDSMGYLRKVVSTTDNNGSLTIQTVPANLNDVFVNKDVKLNTLLMNPGVTLKSTSTTRDISKALTDAKGFIHPVEIIYHDKNGREQLKSALTKSDTITGDLKIIDFNRDLATDLYGKSGDNIHFYVNEGHASLSADAIFDLDFTYDGELTKDTKVKKGSVKTYKFYLDGEADFLAKLALDMSQSYEKEDVKKLLHLKKVTAKFFVGGVPIWITFGCDIFGSYHFNADASLHTDWGFESNHSLQVGGIYDRASDTYTPIKEYTPTNTVYPLNIEGEVNASARLEIYPRVDVKFYSIFGPYAEIVPYVEGDYNAKLQSQITTSGSENFLAWNSDVDLGLDLRVGTELSFVGLINKKFGPTTVNCFSTPLWESPTNLTLSTTLPADTTSGTTLPLKFKVTDLLGNAVPLCPVYISGDGTFSKEILTTDTNGEATVDWTLPNSEGTDQFAAKIYKADESVVDEVDQSLNVKSGSISVPIDMVFVQGGTFQMGSTTDSYAQPVHSVTLSSFYIGKTEVTQAQWVAVMGSNPSYFKGDDLPVEQVSWSDVQTFITKLNQQTGKNYRLPTEAEWEFAARGGNNSKGYTYSGSNTSDDVAWFYHWDGNDCTHPVGTKQPNELGLYDMSGNVCEWCSDWYGSYSNTAQTNPTGPASGSYRVLRGGSWGYVGCRVTDRAYYSDEGWYGSIGFRLAHSSN